MKNYIYSISIVSLCWLILACSNSNSDDGGGSTTPTPTPPPTETVPTLTTTALSNIESTTAASGGTISSDGGSSITARGVVWDTKTAPTIALSTKTTDGTGSGTFVSNLKDLLPSTTYYVRAYATNSKGTAYGNELSFNTTGITTAQATDIISCMVKVSAETSAIDKTKIVKYGIVYGTNPNPEVGVGFGVGGSKLTQGTVSPTYTNKFTHTLSILAKGTKYYAKAYALTFDGTGNKTVYGNEINFTTTNGTTLLMGTRSGVVAVEGNTTYTHEDISTGNYPISALTSAGNSFLIAISGTNLYTVRKEDPDRIFKNESAIKLEGRDNAKNNISSIFADGEDVYLGGNINYSNGNYTMVSWKNENIVQFSTPYPSFANSVFYSKTKGVLTAGTLRHDITYSNSASTALLMQQSVLSYLPPIALNAGQHCNAQDVFESGGDIYVVGTYSNSTYKVGEIKLWKNYVEIPFHKNYTTDSFIAQSLHVVNNDIYVAANINRNSVLTACIIKNGVVTELGKSYSFSYATDMTVIGTDVYVLGYVVSGGEKLAKYWKNGVEYSIGKGDTFNIASN